MLWLDDLDVLCFLLSKKRKKGRRVGMQAAIIARLSSRLLTRSQTWHKIQGERSDSPAPDSDRYRRILKVGSVSATLQLGIKVGCLQEKSRL